ncbi:MAG TPA: glycosyltransferase family 39 protein [Solirubrobacteraceae bacterium]|nr:glycosyltransferase family 39 protein [Solirubrobacteraceae bacterium]
MPPRRLTLASETTTNRALGRRARRLRDDTAAVALLTLLAAAIRLPTLAEQSFWLDEGYTVRLVRMSFGGMLHTIPRTESTPPLYYVLAWAWTHVFGSSEFGLRSLSAVAGIATVPVAYAAARRLAGARAAVICGLLIAASPIMVWFSQEARAYALAALLSTVTVLCLVGWLLERRTRWLAGWAVAAALGLVTHYFLVFIVVGELAILWWRWRAQPDRRLAVATTAVVAVAIALVPLALAQRGTGHADYIAQGSLTTRILQVPKQFLIGYASPAQVGTAVAATLLVLAGAVWPLVRNRAARRRAAIPLAVGLGAVVVPVLLAVVGIDFLDTRNLLPALPPLALAASIGFAAAAPRLPRRAMALGLAAILLAVVVLVDLDPVYQRDNWRGAALALGPSAAARAIVVTPGFGLTPLQAYLPRLGPLARPAAVREIDVVAIPVQVTGAGIGIPPRPATPLPVPPGFRLVHAVASRTYTVLIYRAAAPAVVTGASAAADHLGHTSYTPLLQSPVAQSGEG